MFIAFIIGLLVGAALGYLTTSAIVCGKCDDAFRAGYHIGIRQEENHEAH